MFTAVIEGNPFEKGASLKAHVSKRRKNKPNRKKADTEHCPVSAFYHISGKSTCRLRRIVIYCKMRLQKY